MPQIKLSTLAIVLGLLMGLPQIYGLVKPESFRESVRRFPRSMAWGYTLMGAGTAWFVFNLSLESIADFAAWKNVLIGGFAGVGIGTCIFVQDFLAVRGLAVVLLLLAKLMVDTGRPFLPNTFWVVVFQTWAYALVLAGMWLTVSPWRLRDLLNWATATDKRIKLGCGLRLTFGLFIAALGMFKY